MAAGMVSGVDPEEVQRSRARQRLAVIGLFVTFAGIFLATLIFPSSGMELGRTVAVGGAGLFLLWAGGSSWGRRWGPNDGRPPGDEPAWLEARHLRHRRHPDRGPRLAVPRPADRKARRVRVDHPAFLRPRDSRRPNIFGTCCSSRSGYRSRRSRGSWRTRRRSRGSPRRWRSSRRAGSGPPS